LNFEHIIFYGDKGFLAIKDMKYEIKNNFVYGDIFYDASLLCKTNHLNCRFKVLAIPIKETNESLIDLLIKMKFCLPISGNS